MVLSVPILHSARAKIEQKNAYVDIKLTTPFRKKNDKKSKHQYTKQNIEG